MNYLIEISNNNIKYKHRFCICIINFEKTWEIVVYLFTFIVKMKKVKTKQFLTFIKRDN